MMNITLRKADKKDIPEIIALISELATYERAPQEVTVSAEDLEKDAEDQLQKVHDKFMKKIDDLIAGKNKEIMTV